jgi:hypothetical protein
MPKPEPKPKPNPKPEPIEPVEPAMLTAVVLYGNGYPLYGGGYQLMAEI